MVKARKKIISKPKKDDALEMNAYIIPLLLEIMENKDQCTLLHSSRVQKIIHLLIPSLLRQKLIKKSDVALLWVSAILHDVGKIFVKDNILEAARVLNSDEYNHIKFHPQRGYHLIKQLNLPKKILEAVRYHHERWDGRTHGQYPGYPDGLAGKQIPLFARIIGIADAFDAMIFGRPYKRPIKFEDAMNIIKENSEKQFDPILVDIFIHTIKKGKL